MVFSAEQEHGSVSLTSSDIQQNETNLPLSIDDIGGKNVNNLITNDKFTHIPTCNIDNSTIHEVARECGDDENCGHRPTYKKRWSRYRQSMQAFKPYRKTAILERIWEEELHQRGIEKASFLRSVLRFLRTRFLLGMMCVALCFTMGMINSAFTIRRFIAYTADPDASLKDGVSLCFLLGSMYFGAASFISVGYTINSRNGTRIRAAIIALVYKKLLRAKTLSGVSIGQIGSARIITKFRRRCLQTTDKRVRMINELITCIKLIKMYAWEIPFKGVIAEIREKERRELEKSAFLTSFNASASPLACTLASIATFSVHIALGNNLTAMQAFTCIAVTNSMRVLFLQTPRSVRCMADCAVAAQRIKKLLLISDIQEKTPEPRDITNSIEFRNATLGWKATATNDQTVDDTEKVLLLKTQLGSRTSVNTDHNINTLFDINFNVKKGELVGICGSVGSGKSSLLSALLGQMDIYSGFLATRGLFAYVAQEAIILNDTLKENILFGNEFNQQKYDSAIFNSCLSHDISILPSGDETEIGERGINLSGGQKQRVSLARAMYAERDIYLLDDPLSAVDVHVGQHIFTHCVKGALQNKTILFVTHQLQYLKHCDRVVMLDCGTVIESGTFEKLMDDEQEFSSLINKYYCSEVNENKSRESSSVFKDSLNVSGISNDISPALPSKSVSTVNEGGELTKQETNNGGSVKMETYTITLETLVKQVPI
ncbi:ATP-binding cassette sub-family C member 5-like [Antedon mediterranea]|uniref:ATP-binding cassette sub-family C member 5-like n=1 Tax=Antedon mediterranea TaxID=105859 RepID=UPI003AF9B147